MPQRTKAPTSITPIAKTTTLMSVYGSASPWIDAWRNDYNYLRPHSSLGALTPVEFVKAARGRIA
jgi:hypothetical protein